MKQRAYLAYTETAKVQDGVDEETHTPPDEQNKGVYIYVSYK